MYYSCGEQQLATCVMEWKELLAVAGTEDNCRGWGEQSLPNNGTVRPAPQPQANPDLYPIAMASTRSAPSPCSPASASCAAAGPRPDVQLWRHSPRDAAVVAPPLALALLAPALPWLSGHGLMGMSLATAAIALAVWWLSNTAAHIHLHTPVFRGRPLNQAFSLLLSLLTGVPQTIWRSRHLAHHRGDAPGPLRPGLHASLEIAVVANLWLALATWMPSFLLAVYLPGLLLGLGLCQLQGRGEHLAGPGGISYDAPLHNRLWFNDGYHAEHHRWPGAHWTALSGRRLADAPRSRLSPVLRALLRDPGTPVMARLLGGLERLALACPPLQRALVRVHARAIARLMPALAARLTVPGDLSERPVRIAVVGGGLFPRTALALARVWPAA